MSFKAYNELAWVDEILTDQESYQVETSVYINQIKKPINKDNITILHLGCGAGGHDYHFKKKFEVTGLDISPGMLEIARRVNPEVDYHLGDMRDFEFARCFDVVIIPDSIAYMSNLIDLRKVLVNAKKHLLTGGVIIIVANIKDNFRNSNFVYTGQTGDIDVTLFENNHIISASSYEATLFYLIRQGTEKNIYVETHTLGLFSYQEWLDLLTDMDLEISEFDMNHLYDEFLKDDGEYNLKVFVCKKR